MSLTRIQNNQITDSSSGNVYLGVNAAAKVQDYSITSGKIANNLVYGSDLTITGNLTVNGNTTTIDTVNLVVEDPLILLAKEQTGTPTLDIGFIGKRGTDTNIAFVWDEAQDQFVTAFTTSENTNTTVTIDSYASFKTLDLTATGNLSVTGNTTFTGNITSLNVTGNITGGNLLTGGVISSTGTITGGNLATGGTVSATGTATVGNVATGGTVSATGTITGGNLATGGTVSATGTATVGNVATGGTVSATGTITGGNLATGGTVSATGTATVGNLATAGTVSATGNVTGGNVLTGGLISAGGNVLTGGLISASGNVDAGNVNTTNVSATGNVSAVGFTGGNASVTGNVYAQNFIGNISGNIDAGGANTNVQFNDDDVLAGSANFTFDKSTNIMSVTGTIQGTTVSATGNVIGGNVTTAGLVSATGTVTGGNVATGGTVSATGTITGGNVATGGTVSATGTITGGNLATGGTVSATGTATVGNLATGGTVSATGNITGGNVYTAGEVSATGNVTGNYFIGNGALLSGIDTTLISNGNSNVSIPTANGNVTVSVTGTSNVVVVNSAGGDVNGYWNATGNVTGANITTTGLISATGTATAGNLATGGTMSAGGNVTGANLITSGLITATGTATVGNLATGGTVSATGNATAGNVLTGGLVSAGGNVTGANLITGGLITATGTATVGNLSTAGTASAGGNVTGGNVISNGIITAAGNISGNNISAGGFVSAIGNVITPTVVTTTVTTSSGDLILDSAAGNLQWDGTGNIVMDSQWINNVSNPVQAQDAATKEYVDNAVSTGITIHTPVYAEAGSPLTATYAQGGTTATVTDTIAGNTVVFSSAINPQVNDQLWFTSSFSGIVANVAYFVVSAPNTSAAVLSTTYNGTPVSNISNATGLTQAVRINSGIGATLTANSNGQLTVDGINPPTNARILVYTQTTAYENGVYVVTDTGNVSAPYILTRSTDTNTYAPDDIAALDAGDYFFVQYGNTAAGESYVMTAPIGPFIIGYNGLTFTQFSASSTYSANTAAGLVLNGTIFSAKVDNDTTAFDGGGNISVKAGANLVTPNIGDATGSSLSVTGNVNSGNVNTGIMSASGNVTGANLITSGLITATGTATVGNLATAGTVSATGTVTGGNIATGGTVSATGTATVGNLATAGTVSAGGNVTGANLVTTGLVTATGNVNAGNVNVTNVSATGNVNAVGFTGGNASITGNVYAANFVGNVSGNISAAGANTQVLYNSDNIVSASANFTFDQGTNTLSVTGTVQGTTIQGTTVSATGNVIGGNVTTVGLISATGNVTGNYILGNGSLLTGIDTTLISNGNSNVSVPAANGNVTISVTGTSNVVVVNSAGGDVNGYWNATGNVSGGNLTTAGQVSATGTATAGNLATGGTVSATSTITGGNIATGGTVSATGTATVGNLATDGTVSATGNVTGGNVLTGGIVSAAGNIAGGNVNTTNVSATGNVNAVGFTGGNVSVTGNVYAANFVGNISGNIDAAGSNTQVQFNDTTDQLGASANFTFDKATNVMSVTGTIQGTTVSATGNVIGGNVTTAGLVSAIGTITGGNIATGGTVSATGNATAGNVLTGGLISATGNITGANVILTSGIVDGPASGRITINGSGADVDFAVDGDTTANIFYIDAAVGTASFGNSGAITNAIVSFNTTDSIKLPVGNTSQRPNPATIGMTRFNSTADVVEVYTSMGWQAVGATDFTVITADEFTGNGVQTQFTLSANSTTAATIVSINGVVQIPTAAYAVSGNVLTFTEAPSPTDDIDARILTTTTTVTEIRNVTGNAIVEVLDSADTVQITGNLLPSANVTYNLGSPTRAWNNGYFAGNTIYLGNLQLKQADATTFAVYTSDGITAANIDVGSIDVSSITQGTSAIGIAGTNGNAYITVGGTANVLVVSSTLAKVTGDMSVTGNVVAQDVNSLSDAVLKTNIQPLSGVDSVISGLSGVEYDWKNGSGHSYGFLAQEVEQVLPSAVKTGADGLKSINYMMIIPFLVETIKQMGDEIKDLKQTVQRRRSKK